MLALTGCGEAEPASPPTPALSAVAQTPSTVGTTVPPTTTLAPPEHCNDVGFDPSSDDRASDDVASDDVAGDIVAQGLPCAEAEAFVRTKGRPLGPVNGPERLDADGYTCIRTAQDDSGLPSATYSCTNGAKRITFVRT